MRVHLIGDNQSTACGAHSTAQTTDQRSRVTCQSCIATKMFQETDTTYNGWKNRETWNVALWIGNDPGLYSLALESKDYAAFKATMRELADEGVGVSGIAFETPDGVAWGDSGIDVEAIDRMIEELKSND